MITRFRIFFSHYLVIIAAFNLVLFPAQASIKILQSEISVTGTQVVARLDADSAAFGLNAKSYIGIPSADSDQRLAVSGQGPAPAAGEGGGSVNPAYDFAGSTVNIGLPTALDDAGYAYLDDLNAAGQLTVEEMKLVQHQFYDQQVQLGVLGQLALQFMTAGMTAGLTGIQAAMAQAAISGGVQGVVSGDFDIGAILTDVAFAGVSGVLTEAVNLDNILQMQAGQSLLGAVDGKFTWANLVDGLGDSVVKAGLTTAVYGGEFGDNFKSAFKSTVVNLAQADLQSLIGDRHTGENAQINGGEGSVGHVLEHFGLGCIAGAALGGSCAASGVAAGISAIYAGAVDPAQALRNGDQAIATAELFGGLGAAVVSGGDTNATMIASGVAGSAFTNNYLTHAQWDQLAADVRACMGDSDCENQIRASYAALSERQNKEYFACIAANDTACIIRVRDELAEVANNRANIEANLIGLDTGLGGGLAPWKGLLNQDQTAVSATEIVYGDGNRITPQQAQDIFAIDRALLCTGGMSTGDCLAAIASARNERGAAGLVAGAVVIGGLTVAPAALSALASCTANPACLGTLPTLLGELTLGASGATAGSTFVTLGAAGAGLTGKLLLQNGDEILGVLDTVTGQTLRYVGTSASGRALVQTAEGGVGIFDDAGRLVSLPPGVKVTPANVVDIRTLPDGRTVWLETGSDSAGLEHILNRHARDFANKGISSDQIPLVVMDALAQNNVVGTNGSANVYRLIVDGQEKNIAIGVGSNGFVVRANPVSEWNPVQ